MRRSCTRSWGAWRSSIRIFACWTRLRRRWRRRGIRDWRWRSASGGGGARRGNNDARKRRRKRINTEDTEAGAQRAQSEEEERERRNDAKKNPKQRKLEESLTQRHRG